MTAIFIYMLIASLLIYLALSSFSRSDFRPHKEKVGRTRTRFSELGKYRSFLVVLTILIFVRSMFTVSVSTFFPKYLSQFIGSSTLLGEFITISFVPTIIGQPLLGYITASRGGRFTISMTSLLGAGFFFVFMLTHNLIIMLLSFSAYAFMMFSSFPVLLGYVGQVIPSEFTTTANSLVWGTGSTIGGAAGISVVTALTLLTSIATSFWIMLILGVIAAILLTALSPKQSEYRSPTILAHNH